VSTLSLSGSLYIAGGTRAGAYGYFVSATGTATAPQLLKVDLGSMVLVSSLPIPTYTNSDGDTQLFPGDGSDQRAAAANDGTYGYFGFNARIYKVHLDSMTVDSFLSLHNSFPSQQASFGGGVLGDVGYFSTTNSSEGLIKVHLNNMTRAGSTQVDGFRVRGMCIDDTREYGYTTSGTALTRIRLGDMAAVSKLAVPETPVSVTLDSRGYAYVGTHFSPSVVKVKVAAMSRVGTLAVSTNGASNPLEFALRDGEGNGFFGPSAVTGQLLQAHLLEGTDAAPSQELDGLVLELDSRYKDRALSSTGSERSLTLMLSSAMDTSGSTEWTLIQGPSVLGTGFSGVRYTLSLNTLPSAGSVPLSSLSSLSSTPRSKSADANVAQNGARTLTLWSQTQNLWYSESLREFRKAWMHQRSKPH
jgi:hypothetical protein